MGQTNTLFLYQSLERRRITAVFHLPQQISFLRPI